MATDPRTLRIPRDLLPEDGRFGSGPSRVRDAQVDALASRAGRALLGTSHRQAPVRALVGRLRSGVATLFALPAGYEVALGVGGSTLFWDLTAYSLIEGRSAHAVHGEFSAKFALAARAPHLKAPLVVEAAPWIPRRTRRRCARARRSPRLMHGRWYRTRRALALRHRSADRAIASGASCALASPLLTPPPPQAASPGIRWRRMPTTSRRRRGSAQMADSGSRHSRPRRCERAERIATSRRFIPGTLSLHKAILESRKDQTLNTPAIATLLLAAEQIDWLNASGGLSWAAARCAESSGRLYDMGRVAPVGFTVC